VKVLFLTPQLPFPPKSGGVVKSFELVKFLSKEFTLSIGTLLKGDDTYHVRKFITTIRVDKFYSEEISVDRTLSNFFKSLFYKIPLSIYRNRSEKFIRLINEEAFRFDVIFVDHYLMFQYIPNKFSGRIILHEHNAEFTIWKSFASKEGSTLKKLILKYEANRVRQYEKMICQRADTVLAAPNDIENLKTLGLASSSFETTLHLGDNELLLLDNLSFALTEKKLLFVGTLSWEPNRDGLQWFLESIMPAITSIDNSIKLTIIGRGCDTPFKNYLSHNPNCEFIGEVEDLAPHYERSRVFISPLRFGSGIKVKNINAMYRGIPLVTTSIGVEGLNVIHNSEAVIADDNMLMANEIISLLNDQKRWEAISTKSREFSKRELSWTPVLATVKRVVECNK